MGIKCANTAERKVSLTQVATTLLCFEFEIFFVPAFICFVLRDVGFLLCPGTSLTLAPDLLGSRLVLGKGPVGPQELSSVRRKVGDRSFRGGENLLCARKLTLYLDFSNKVLLMFLPLNCSERGRGDGQHFKSQNEFHSSCREAHDMILRVREFPSS